MQNEYRSGIASSIALSQIQYAASGFSIGFGHGEFKDMDESGSRNWLWRPIQ